MISIELKTLVHPTEDEEIIKKSFRKIYPFDNFVIGAPNNRGVYEISVNAVGSQTLQYLFSQIRRQRTVETIHNYTQERLNPITNSCQFNINKQALTMGFIVLSTEPNDSPLGPVSMTVFAKNIVSVMNYLFPNTQDGKVIEVDYRPNE